MNKTKRTTTMQEEMLQTLTNQMPAVRQLEEQAQLTPLHENSNIFFGLTE